MIAHMLNFAIGKLATEFLRILAKATAAPAAANVI